MQKKVARCLGRRWGYHRKQAAVHTLAGALWIGSWWVWIDATVQHGADVCKPITGAHWALIIWLQFLWVACVYTLLALAGNEPIIGGMVAQSAAFPGDVVCDITCAQCGVLSTFVVFSIMGFTMVGLAASRWLVTPEMREALQEESPANATAPPGNGTMALGPQTNTTVVGGCTPSPAAGAAVITVVAMLWVAFAMLLAGHEMRRKRQGMVLGESESESDSDEDEDEDIVKGW